MLDAFKHLFDRGEQDAKHTTQMAAESVQWPDEPGMGMGGGKHRPGRSRGRGGGRVSKNREALSPGSTVVLSTGHKVTPREWATAKRSHEHRRRRSQYVDEGRQAPVTTDVDKWRRHPDRYDYPGVDTRRPVSEYLQEEDREEFRSLTHRLWTWQPGSGRGL